MNSRYLFCAVLVLGGLSAGCASNPASSPAPVATASAEASPEISPEDRISFFTNDARSGNCDAVRKTLDEGLSADSVDSVDQTGLIAAASKNHLECVRVLLEHGASPDKADTAGWTPLIHATYFGSSLEMISLLVEKGANVNAQNDRGVTALYLASAGGHETYVKHLLSLGADRALATKSGYTALKVAQINGLSNIVALLETGKGASGTH